MTKAQKRRYAMERMEQAGQELIERAYILCAPEHRTTWAVRNNGAELLKYGRKYANAVAAMRRS